MEDIVNCSDSFLVKRLSFSPKTDYLKKSSKLTQTRLVFFCLVFVFSFTPHSKFIVFMFSFKPHSKLSHSGKEYHPVIYFVEVSKLNLECEFPWTISITLKV